MITEMNECDGALGGIFRAYLENLLNAKHVAEFVKKNPFGQQMITNLCWNLQRRAETFDSAPPLQSALLSLTKFTGRVRWWTELIKGKSRMRCFLEEVEYSHQAETFDSTLLHPVSTPVLQVYTRRGRMVDRTDQRSKVSLFFKHIRRGRRQMTVDFYSLSDKELVVAINKLEDNDKVLKWLDLHKRNVVEFLGDNKISTQCLFTLLVKCSTLSGTGKLESMLSVHSPYISLVFPLCYDDHWIGIAVDLSKRRATTMDSLESYLDDKLFNKFFENLKHVLKEHRRIPGLRMFLILKNLLQEICHNKKMSMIVAYTCCNSLGNGAPQILLSSRRDTE
ncbi:hypothetical protein PHJA_001664700 [Phtheirospermum japonicum]|uniref:Ubiquitin-like protease family profile domain-containing protein n=1 Tax=Phtheirospermum japonicum TaxID=374723 RepID=A0A830CH27_9LAMI|nr:hypothetical protein PHJA_001664700 [Phtheirospermum japonicum]